MSALKLKDKPKNRLTMRFRLWKKLLLQAIGAGIFCFLLHRVIQKRMRRNRIDLERHIVKIKGTDS